MNKRIKKIIAMTLTVCAFSAVSPMTLKSGFMMPQAVSASEDSYGITDLNFYQYDKEEDDDTELKLYENSRCDSSDELDFSRREKTYYTKTDGKFIKVDAEAEQGYTVKIFKNDSDTAYDSGEKVSLSSGDNIIYVRTYEDGKFDRENIKTGVEKTYKIYVKRSSEDDLSLKDIQVQYGNIAFSKDETSYDVNVKDRSQIEITAIPQNSDNKVRIDGNTTDSDNVGTVDLKAGKNKIDIDVEDEDSNVKTYVLNIYRGGGAPNDKSDLIDNEQDKVYLDELNITDSDDKTYDIHFSKYITSYDFKVDSDVDNITISALPYIDEDYENDDYRIRVNDSTVTSEKTVDLEENEENTIEVSVENRENDKVRTYKLNVTRGTVEDKDDDEDKKDENTDEDLGKDNKNSWAFNDSTHTYRYYDANGNIVINKWIQIDGKYYYADQNGDRKSGWLMCNGKYYYMDENGVMQTGWKVIGPTYYYLNSNGDMATGWIKPSGNEWYYMDSDGSMRTGWKQIGDSWYYMNSSGAMVTGKQIINGKSYNFSDSGILL
ncbi:cadherin-like beta sandwich domain-containing protein [Clostridium sp. BJN0001]|uniref:N-acetylmuramoyl-L-alanine amidase family protein n=1 Tax=Clostridium sp. BJN0001 TaxID=2930219 RepID=UPI001FD36F46|nr:cadherin-like beta sandwich domain-containing protein [Clostridium sp. BJN0001]